VLFVANTRRIHVNLNQIRLGYRSLSDINGQLFAESGREVMRRTHTDCTPGTYIGNPSYLVQRLRPQVPVCKRTCTNQSGVAVVGNIDALRQVGCDQMTKNGITPHSLLFLRLTQHRLRNIDAVYYLDTVVTKNRANDTRAASNIENWTVDLLPMLQQCINDTSINDIAGSGNKILIVSFGPFAIKTGACCQPSVRCTTMHNWCRKFVGTPTIDSAA